MVVTLAAMLGQIGLPGGGFGQRLRLARLHRPGAPARAIRRRCRSGANPVRAVIPFARFADMLLQPGEPFDFDGQRAHLPAIRLVYWCGGNPFHHHQDLGRLRRALATGRTRSSSTIRSGRRWRATPTSCCRRR